MKANRQIRPPARTRNPARRPRPPHGPLATAATAALIALLGSCVPPPAPPAATPPAPRRPIAAYAPPPSAPAGARDWHDQPLTPGDWHWATDAAGGRAWYAAPDGADLLTLRCTRAGSELTLSLAGRPANPAAAPGPRALTITTTTRTRDATATATADGGVVLRLGSRDPVLDAMAFSRGRFMIAAEGIGTAIVPSWPEVSRVIEDCRAGTAALR